MPAARVKSGSRKDERALEVGGQANPGAHHVTILIGLVITLGCLLGGFVAMGGHVGVIWQPWEYVIICGSALGTFVVANPMKTIKDSGTGVVEALTNDAPTSREYLDVLAVLLLPDARSAQQAAQRGRGPFRRSRAVADLPEVPERHQEHRAADVHLRLLPPDHHRQRPHARDRGADGRGDPDHQERQAQGLSLHGDDLGGASRRSASSPPCSA